MPTPEQQVEQIERDRKKRERILLLALLDLADEARVDAIVLLKHEADVSAGIRRVLTNPTDGVPELIAGAMANAHLAAYPRLADYAGVSVAEPDEATLKREYQQQGNAAAESMIATLTAAIATATNELSNETPEDVIDAAFDTAGYTEEDQSALEIGAERAIVTASNAGMLAAAKASGRRIKLMHVSVLDSVTTEICRDRDGLVKYADDPYWAGNTPALHYNCRSAIVIAPDDAAVTPGYPATPPMAGFGYSPVPLTAAA